MLTVSRISTRCTEEALILFTSARIPTSKESRAEGVELILQLSAPTPVFGDSLLLSSSAALSIIIRADRFLESVPLVSRPWSPLGKHLHLACHLIAEWFTGHR